VAGDRAFDVDRFDRWSATYERSPLQAWFFQPIHQATLDAASSLVPAPGRLLDVGCGTGRLARTAAGRFPAAGVFGIDLAPGIVERAADLGGATAWWR
jgi:trans-aconitate methyltransferase